MKLGRRKLLHQLVERRSYDPARAVYLPSVAPPLLSLNADMHGLIVFLERFQQYQNLGGTIELRQ
jgi:hypothetical protein